MGGGNDDMDGAAHPKKKDTLAKEIFDSCESAIASAAEALLQVIPPTSNHEVAVVGTSSKTSLVSVADAIPCNTLLEFESSLDDLDDELSETDESEDSQALIFPAMLSNLEKVQDGGYRLIFDVPENSSQDVGKLVAGGSRVFSLVVIEQE